MALWGIQFVALVTDVSNCSASLQDVYVNTIGRRYLIALQDSQALHALVSYICCATLQHLQQVHCLTVGQYSKHFEYVKIDCHPPDIKSCSLQHDADSSRRRTHAATPLRHRPSSQVVVHLQQPHSLARIVTAMRLSRAMSRTSCKASNTKLSSRLKAIHVRLLKAGATACRRYEGP